MLKNIDKKLKKKGIIACIGVVGVVILTTYTYISNKQIESVLEMKDSRLETREIGRVQVADDLIRLFSIVDAQTYTIAKDNSLFTDEMKDKYYGSTYDIVNHPKLDKVVLKEVKYTIEGAESYYVKLGVEKEGEYLDVGVMVSVSNGKIYNIAII